MRLMRKPFWRTAEVALVSRRIRPLMTPPAKLWHSVQSVASGGKLTMPSTGAGDPG
jgi:hypothetical protein